MQTVPERAPNDDICLRAANPLHIAQVEIETVQLDWAVGSGLIGSHLSFSARLRQSPERKFDHGAQNDDAKMLPIGRGGPGGHHDPNPTFVLFERVCTSRRAEITSLPM